MKGPELYLEGLAPHEETPWERKRRYEKIEREWEQASPIASDMKKAKSLEELFRIINPILPQNLKKKTAGETIEEKLDSWANTPLDYFDHEEGLILNINGGEFLSHTAQMQKEFQDTLRENLVRLGAKGGAQTDHFSDPDFSPASNS